MKDINGNDLPQPYYDLAVMRWEKKSGVKDASTRLITAFEWGKTPEENEFWHEVFKGNSPTIPQASLDELDAWMREKKFEKRGKPETDWQAKYEELCKRYKALEHNHNRLCQDYDFYKHRTNVTPNHNFIAECVPFQKCPVCDGYGEVRPLWNKNAQEPTYVKCDVCDGNKVILMYNAEAMAAEGKKRGHLPKN